MAKKRANGEGNIRKRKDGRWEGRYTAGHDPETGKAIYKNVLGRTQTEAKSKLKAAIDKCAELERVLEARSRAGDLERHSMLCEAQHLDELLLSKYFPIFLPGCEPVEPLHS